MDASHIVTCRAGETLFRQQTPVSHVLFLQSGLVKIYRELRNNRQAILSLVTPGNYCGLTTVCGEELYRYNASVVDQSQIILTGIQAFRQIISQNGEFAGTVLRESCREGLEIQNKLINQFQKQLPGRVAEMLLFFSEKIYHSPSFSLPMSRRELAEFTGTTKESMIRTLAEFRHDKIIRLDGQKVEITSHEIINTLSRLG